MCEKVDGRIAVIGAGVAGVATATALHAAGLEFVVYDRNDGVGGLWFQNYPGASGKFRPCGTFLLQQHRSNGVARGCVIVLRWSYRISFTLYSPRHNPIKKTIGIMLL